MSAIRLARGYTGRNKIIKFEGHYHGHADPFLVKAGSGVATFNIQTVPGVTPGVAQDTLTAAYNDLEAVKKIAAAHKGEIASIIVEPVAGNMGCILPQPGFLEGLRSLCDVEGIVLILDEVMTGFRLSLGGAQQLYNIKPDLTTLGKIIGGGLPCAAFGGRADVMNFLAPLGPVYQAGTLSGNPLAMAAGIATLQHLIGRKDDIYPALAQTTAAIASGVAAIAQENGVKLTANQVGSMFTWFFTGDEVFDFATAAKSDTAAFGRFHRAMLENGVWLPPSQYEAAFVSTMHGEAEVALLLDAARKVFSTK